MSPSDVMRLLERAGVRVVRLDAPTEVEDGEAHLLVRRAERRLAVGALEEADWRFQVGSRGLWRVTRRASYGWEGGPAIHLHWGLPAAPLPSSALARLERLLWERARRDEAGRLRADPVVQVVLASVQAARPDLRRTRWRIVAAEAASRVDDWAAVVLVANAANVGGSVRRVLAGTEATHLPSGRESWSDRVWLMSRRAQRRVHSRRLRALLAGTPLLGRSVRRCRFAGIEVLAGPGVFRPMAVTEDMVEAVLDALTPNAPATVLEAGTGCGAVSLAIAVARPDVEIHAADVSAAALRWARRNQRTLGTRVSFRRGSLLEPFGTGLAGRVAVVAGNVPYIPPERAQPASEDTPGAVLGEDEDGLGLVRRLSLDARRFLRPDGRLILQLLDAQWETFGSELESIGFLPGPVVGRRGPHVVVTATRR